METSQSILKKRDPAGNPATAFLQARNIKFSLFHHPSPPVTIEQAALERNQTPDQVVRSILFRTQADEFVMVLIAGPAQVSWPKLRHYLGLSRITMANPEEVLAQTGSRPGAVSPFGLPNPIRILADRHVLHPKSLSFGSGVRGSAIILESHDLLNALPSLESGDFTTSKL
ncbi:MAG: YbaK/EbsC family protein [Anaerolineaceae bacterium]|nr:YbaK/EbsC family protein [Anaerolineaceae bacterium]